VTEFGGRFLTGGFGSAGFETGGKRPGGRWRIGGNGQAGAVILYGHSNLDWAQGSGSRTD